MSLIADLLSSQHKFAVVGVSQDATKYGYELFEVLSKNGHEVLPVNPKYHQIDNQPCYPSLSELPYTRMWSLAPFPPILLSTLPELALI